jgi:8-oxo-dGTP diphosphatase
VGVEMGNAGAAPDQRKRLAAGAFFRNDRGELLIVKPTYRDGWLIPGGAVEARESPFAACVREVQEELGLQLRIGRLLCIEYQSVGGFGDENLQFIFDGGVLTAAEVACMRLPPDELAASTFVTALEAVKLLVPRLARRLPFALEAVRTGGTLYLEDGRLIGTATGSP